MTLGSRSRAPARGVSDCVSSAARGLLLPREMKLRRVLLGALASAVWPAVVVCIPAGITFYATRVLAESAPLPPLEPCDAGTFTACADAEALSYCSSTTCTSTSCACVESQRCAGGSSPLRGCREVSTCESQAALIAACRGTPTGSRCSPPGAVPESGTCKLDRCLVPGDGGFVGSPEVFCAGGELPSASVPDAGRETSPPPTSSAPRAVDDSGGCAASSGTTQGAALLLGLPLAMSVLFARRRRRR